MNSTDTAHHILYELGESAPFFKAWNRVDIRYEDVEGARVITFLNDSVSWLHLYTLIIHRDFSNKRLWTISEYSSGFTAGAYRDRSRRAAIEQAFAALSNVDSTWMEEAIKRAMSKVPEKVKRERAE